MQLLPWNFQLVFLVFGTLDVNKADDSCPSFQAVNSSVAGDEVFTVNLTYVVTPCGEQKNSEIVVKTLRGNSTRSPPACIISIKDTVCNSRVGCSCISEPGRVFMVTIEVESFDEEEEWLIVGILNNQEIFRDNITLRCPVDAMQETSHSLPAEGDSTPGQMFASTTTDDPNTVSTNQDAKDLTTALVNKQIENMYEKLKSSIVLFGTIGCAIAFLALCTAVGVLARKRLTHRKDLQTSVSVHSLVLNGLKRAGLSKELLGGSNVSLMITNDMYGDYTDMPSAASSLNVGLCEKILPQLQDNCLNGNDVEDSADAPPSAVNMATRERMPLPPEAFSGEDEMGAVGGASLCSEEGDYAEINDLLDEINEAERNQQGKPQLDESN